MAMYRLKNRELFRIEDSDTKVTHYGSDQDWYLKRWQRMAGCGPSTATNMMYYYGQHLSKDGSGSIWSKDQFLTLMNELWKYVTPSIGGVSSTTMFCQGLLNYLKKKQINLNLNSIDVSKKLSERPASKQILAFIAQALEADSPVAFLNLERGAIEELESWHWVTIMSLEYEEGGNTAITEILDNGIIRKIDLLEWLRTTKAGGGFVSYRER